MKVYLVMEMFERGFDTEEKPYKVYTSKARAEFVADRIYGFVKELDFVEGEGFDL